MDSDDEKNRLLSGRNRRPSDGQSCLSLGSNSLTASVKIASLGGNGATLETQTQEVCMERHLTLANAVAIMIGGVAGSGIFIAPTGVTQSVKSVGTTLIIWTVCGLFSLTLAICYAELGTAFPVTGGDYTYIARLLGPLPAFLYLWISTVVIGPATSALMARTASIHIFQMINLECNNALMAFMSVWILLTFSYLNIMSVRWSAKLMTVFSLGKVAAMGTVIILGIIRLGQGYTDNFKDPFKGSETDPVVILGSFLPGYFAYAGWDFINTLVGEMKNPKRDLPLSVVISGSSVIVIFVLTNMAYFTALNPAEFAQSDAVAQVFATRAIPYADWVIPVFVALAALGSVNGMTLVFPRYTFAGAQDNQLPALLSHVHISKLTPLPAILLQSLLSVVFAALTFFDIQQLLAMIGLIVQLKALMGLLALLKLKWKHSDLPRTVKKKLRYSHK